MYAGDAITEEEVKAAMDKVELGKSASPDIAPKFINYGGPELTVCKCSIKRSGVKKQYL